MHAISSRVPYAALCLIDYKVVGCSVPCPYDNEHDPSETRFHTAFFHKKIKQIKNMAASNMRSDTSPLPYQTRIIRTNCMHP